MFNAENFYPPLELSGWDAAACKSMCWKSRQRPVRALFGPKREISSVGRQVTGNVAHPPHKVHRSEQGPSTALGGIY